MGFRNNWYGFLLPEHREQLQALLHSEEPVSMPQLSEDRLRDIQYAIEEAWAYEHPITCEYIDRQMKKGFCGWIETIDQKERWLLLRNGSHQRKIDFAQIYAVERMEDVPD